MADQITHPADRAVHAVNNALQILMGLVDADLTPQPTWMVDVGDARRRLEGVTADIQALQDFSRAQSAELMELREQGIREKQYIDRLETRNSAITAQLITANRKLAQANAEVEQLLQCASIRLQGETADFNRIRSLRDTLRESTVVGENYTIVHHEPRVAAAGGQ